MVMFDNIQLFAMQGLEQQLYPICWHPGTCFLLICNKISASDHLFPVMQAIPPYHPLQTHANPPTTEEIDLFVIVVVF